MSDLHKTAQHALEALELAQTDVHWSLRQLARAVERAHGIKE